MQETSRVATPPPKPLMIYDGDCRFCALWIKRWQQTTAERVDYLPFQDASLAERFPEIPRAQFETAVQLVETDGRVYSGAEAALRALAQNPDKRWLLRCYEKSPLFASISERGYRFVAEHRTLFSALTRFAYGNHVEKPAHFLVRWTFLRALGVIYLIAFLSLWTQINGLIGSNGILPASQFMSGLAERATIQGVGIKRFWMLPTLCWFNVSDTFLHVQCGAGVVLAALLVAGIAPAPCLFLLWLVYLSLAVVCREFLGFQWDNLLLEIGFLAIFLAPLQLWSRPSRESPPSRIVLWLLRWLLFRLMFESGCVKLLSGDEVWRNLTALAVHYETQPLPTWIGWWAHQLPSWFQKASCLVMFVIELVVPFLIFAPRRLRIFGGAATVLLQVLILLTGNYTFFNLLTLALCLTLLDDFTLAKFLPIRSHRRKEVEGSQLDSVRLSMTPERRAPSRPVSTPDLERAETVLGAPIASWLRGPALRRGVLFTSAATKPCHRWPRVVTIPLAIVIISVTSLPLLAMFGVRSSVLSPVVAVYRWLSPLHSFNNYGLFAGMTKSRPEIIVEGSNDGVTWLSYEFKYKPGRVGERPRFVAPHQPRLDWQMWFAALGNVQGNPWFVNFCVRLLQGSPEVLALLEKNPFPEKPPKFVRAEVYEYHFTDLAEHRRTGNWWRREFKGEYLPPVSLREGN